MTGRFRLRDERGKFASGPVREEAEAMLGLIHDFDRIDGWGWLRLALCRFCLNKALKLAHDSAPADIWISRYQALRDIG